jgi:hypothetical protein
MAIRPLDIISCAVLVLSLHAAVYDSYGEQYFITNPCHGAMETL